MNLHLPTAEAESLATTETHRAIVFSIAFATFTLFAAVALAITGRIVSAPPDWMRAGILALVALGAFLVLGVLFVGWRRGGQHVRNVVQTWIALVNAEIERHTVLPTPTPAHEPSPAPVILVDRVGGMLADGSGDFLDVRDAKWLCEQFANKRDWTERTWTGVRLPFSGYEMTKGENGGYNRVVALFVEHGIISNRGGPGNRTGELVVTDPDDMLRHLRNEVPKVI